jgi:hypothetical protein
MDLLPEKWINCWKKGFTTRKNGLGARKMDLLPEKWINCQKNGFVAVKMD